MAACYFDSIRVFVSCELELELAGVLAVFCLQVELVIVEKFGGDRPSKCNIVFAQYMRTGLANAMCH